MRADVIKKGDVICTVLGVGAVDRVEINKEIRVYEVELSDGGTVKATASHQFHVRDSRKKFFESKRLDQLKTGDWVRVFPSIIPNNKLASSNADLDDRDYGFLVGVLVGDGCYTPHNLSKNVVRISSHNDELEWNKVIEDSFMKVGVTKVYSYVNSGTHSMMMDPKPGRVISIVTRHF